MDYSRRWWSSALSWPQRLPGHLHYVCAVKAWVQYVVFIVSFYFQVDLPLLRILSSRTSVCPLGIFLLKTWAERRNMASTAEPFSRAIWSSRSRKRKPARENAPLITHGKQQWGQLFVEFICMVNCNSSLYSVYRCANQGRIPGIFFVNSTRTWTWLVAISVSKRKFSSALYWSCSWKWEFVLNTLISIQRLNVISLKSFKWFEGNIPAFWPHLEESDVCCKPLRWLSAVPAAL